MTSTEPLPGLRAHPTPAPYPFGPRTVANILAPGLAGHPNALALVDGDRSWTWRELDAAVAMVAEALTPGEAVHWDLANSAEAVIGGLATFRAGGIWVGKSTAADRARLEGHVGEVRVIGLPAAMAMLPDTPGNRSAPGNHTPDIDPHRLAAITFTSGTSGTPKAVAHSQHNLLWPGLVSIDVEPPASGERIGTPLSLGIANMFVLGPLSALLRGSTFVVMTRTHAAGFAADIATSDITRTFVVATMLHDLANAPEIAPQQLASLDRIIVGGSPAAPQLLTTFRERFAIRPTLSYGLSEAPSGVVRESLDDEIGSGRGFPLPHIEVDIVDESGDVVAVGTPGEVCLRPATSGPWSRCWTPTLGYLGEPKRTDALFANGRLRTGDTGVLDSDGALVVTGRLSDIIIRGGANIDPLSVERSAALLDWVTDSLCAGIDDDRLGQQLGVLVVPAPGATIPRDDQLVDALRTATNQPVDHVSIVDALPRNAMGKLVRRWHPTGTG